MSLFMKLLAVTVLVFGIIGSIASPLTLLPVLLETCIGFGLLYSLGEMLSLMKKIRDAEKGVEKSQKETNDILRALIQAGEINTTPVDKANPKEKLQEEAKKEEKVCDYGTGKPIKVDENTIKCPFCGKLQKEDRNFCFYCGAKFERE